MKNAKKAPKAKKVQTVQITRDSAYYLHKEQLDSTVSFPEDTAQKMSEDSVGYDAVWAVLDFVERAQTTLRMLA